MRKLVTINECEDCPFVWWHLGKTECCLLDNKRPCYEDQNYDDAVIPTWCPLPTAPQEIVEAEKQLTIARGLHFDSYNQTAGDVPQTEGLPGEIKSEQIQPCPIGLHEIKVNVKPVGDCDPINLHDASIWYQALKSTYIYMCKRLGHGIHA